MKIIRLVCSRAASLERAGHPVQRERALVVIGGESIQLATEVQAVPEEGLIEGSGASAADDVRPHLLNGMGRDRGAALILDQAILPAATGDRHRTRGFAWCNVLQDAGNALGALLAASSVLLRDAFELEELASIRALLLFNALLLAATALLYSKLSPAAEAPTQVRGISISEESKRSL
jgi:hypothetical protein